MVVAHAGPPFCKSRVLLVIINFRSVVNPALLALSSLEDGLYLFQTDASLDESDRQMVEQISCLIGHLVLIIILVRNDHFCRFFTDFFENLVQPLVIEIAGIEPSLGSFCV